MSEYYNRIETSADNEIYNFTTGELATNEEIKETLKFSRENSQEQRNIDSRSKVTFRSIFKYIRSFLPF